MRPAFALAQHTGSRESQQDSAGVLLRDDFVAALADGMGGLASGAEAGTAAVAAFFETYSHAGALREGLEAAHRAVVRLSRKLGRPAGTTFCAAAIEDDWLHWIWCGDSRIYLQRGGTIRCLTSDHNVGSRMMESGASERLARAHPLASRLTAYLGQSSTPQSGAAELRLKPGDRLLLCSDGVHGTLRLEELRMPERWTVQRACERILERVVRKNRPHQDNATALGIAVPAVG